MGKEPIWETNPTKKKGQETFCFCCCVEEGTKNFVLLLRRKKKQKQIKTQILCYFYLSCMGEFSCEPFRENW